MLTLPLALHTPNPAVPMRPVKLADAEGLHAACWPERPFSEVYALLRRALYNSDNGRGAAVVIVNGGNEYRGFGQFTLWPSCAEISDLVVAEAFRGQGYGTALIQALAGKAKRLGAEEAEIGAKSSNPRAAALYRRLGFEDSHRLMMDFGRGREEVLYLRLRLAQP